ncbi:hypothetical protein SISNIDRAFT_492094 [Sistotremastrum niveocremeum HHB9708]|uniref:Uncharacterized protein n=1 Tax=Sistotremastrum niveocremeum HHB9708 TaxID=1314777 RepID=A0A164M2T4_9AGAM|nr:hypothetical protein SISNIDRAFT_492094 [Sistotremastrum niveocremeum HHB9708]
MSATTFTTLNTELSKTRAANAAKLLDETYPGRMLRPFDEINMVYSQYNRAGDHQFLVGGGIEEQTFQAVGYIVSQRLPPVTSVSDITRTIGWARQTVEISGIGANYFTEYTEFLRSIVEGIRDIPEIRKDPLPESRQVKWKETDFLIHDSLLFSLPYVTELRNASNQEPITFSESIDPHGHMESATKKYMARSLIHTSDNVCEYLARDQELRTPSRDIHPSQINVGDLVNVSFVLRIKDLNASKKKDWKNRQVFLTLRAITKLEHTEWKSLRADFIYPVKESESTRVQIDSKT